MSELDPSDFSAFVHEVHGYVPFPWQQRLVRLIAEQGRWPALLDLPTGTGKTATLDVAVFALAIGSPAARRRIAMVVDRRVIVDQAATRADLLRKRLNDPSGPISTIVAQRLRALGGTSPLHVSVLRGGVPRDGSWALRPDQPTVLLSTVDQVGSRLLFRGYGVSDGMLPVHAGLLGTDTLYLLDEVHLSQPFAQTLDAVRTDFGTPLDRPVSVVHLSATPGDDRTDAFSLDDDDRDPNVAPLLATRLSARKSVRLEDVGGGQIAPKLATKVPRLLKGLDGSVFAVIVNRVDTARAIHERLEGGTFNVHLLTGRMRPLDRAEIMDRVGPEIFAGRSRATRDRPLVVVSTQSIEAGADFDFDGLITELAPIDALRQRLGRLDRLGEAIDVGIKPQAVVVTGKEHTAGDDPVYGDSLAASHRWLTETFGDAGFDGGAESADLASAPPDAVSPKPNAPLLLPHIVALLSQTSPRPTTEPEISWFLHGLGERRADVTVIWRADPLIETAVSQNGSELDLEPAKFVLHALPPASAESMQVPITALRAWMTRSEAIPSVSDVDGALDADVELSPGDDEPRFALRWSAGREVERVGVDDIRPADTLVFAASEGGVAAGNWSPSSTTTVVDRSSDAHLLQRGKRVVRVHRSCLPAGVATVPDLSDATDPAEERELVADWASTIDTGPFRVMTVAGSVGDYLVAFRTRTRAPDDGAVDDFDGTDLVNSFTATGEAISLRGHCAGVGEMAAEFGRRCHLDKELVADLELAGRLHDLGKADPRFQLALFGGRLGDRASDAELVAKSPRFGSGDPESLEAFRRSGYPKGSRHEMLSVGLAVSAAGLSAEANDWDLVLHLVATHHGRGRPFAPVVVDREPEVVSLDLDGHQFEASSDHGLDALGSELADRFWAMSEKYGYWGVAYLEALFRLADHRRSQLEEERSVKQ